MSNPVKKSSSGNTTLLVSKLIKPDIINELSALGIQTAYINQSSHLTTELRFHPDLLICKCCDGTWVTSKDIYNQNNKLFDSLNMTIEISKKELGDTYPADVRFNAFFVGSTLFCSKHTAPEIKAKAEELVVFKQGYVKCSVCTVDSESYITADRGIHAILQSYKKNVLLIAPEGIGLNGFSYGFIGGASGMIKPDTLAFCGDAKLLPDYEKVKDFLANLRINIYSLCDGSIYDYGGFFLV